MNTPPPTPDAACRVAGRDLTPEEWAAVVGDDRPYRSVCSAEAVASAAIARSIDAILAR